MEQRLTEIQAVRDAMTPEELAEEQAKRERSEQEQRDREHRQRVDRRLAALFDGCGNASRSYSLKKFTCSNKAQETVRDAIFEYMNDWPTRLKLREGLILYGPVGSGKDHLAIGTAAHLIVNDEASARWMSGQELYGEIRDRMDTDKSERSLIESLASSDILIVSDPLPPFGELSQHQAAMLLRIVDRRYCQGKMTWVTVNVADDAEADRRMGAATWDRLCHGAWKLKCAWASYRKPARTINC